MKTKLILLSTILLFSCTQNQRARNFVGTENIDLPKNRILITATWKKDDLWILTKDTIEKKMYFNEISSFGIWQGTINFNNK